jgi:CheY-like chemotaxis protein
MNQLCFVSSNHHAEKGGLMATEHRTGYQKILVVDDHEASAHHTVTSLSQISESTKLTSTGTNALRIAEDWLPDLVIMDIGLPDMNGLEAIRLIQAGWPASHPLPDFIVLSGDDPGLRRDELEASGIAHTLLKPVSGQRLRELFTLKGDTQIPPIAPDRLQLEIQDLFKAELEQRLPQLELCLSDHDHEKAAGLVHQLIASSAMTGESRLESQFRLLDRLLQQQSAPAELASTYYRTLEAAHNFLYRAGNS